LDDRILPNGRRDHFEQNVHFRNVLTQLTPIARELGRLCRINSVRRNWIRRFEQGVAVIKERQAILRQGAITRERVHKVRGEIADRFAELEKITTVTALEEETRTALRKRLSQLSTKLRKGSSDGPMHDLKRFRGSRRRLVQKLVGIVYDATEDQAAAKVLVDRILRRL
jgi:molecular chaperone HtpG